MSLAGKVALITGGAKNLGRQTALDLAALGCSLAIHYNSAATKPAADALAAELKASFPAIKAAFYAGDLTTKAGVDALFAAATRDFGPLDIVVQTVGKVLKKPVSEISEAEYDDMFAINSKSAFLVMQAGATAVRDGGKIIVVVTSLLAAYTGLYTSYAGSKAPVEHFVRGLSKELMPRRVSVNAIAPGPMDTPFFYGQETPDAVAFHKSNAMGGRLTEVADIAPIIRFLCTDGSWFNGQTLLANGGYTTR